MARKTEFHTVEFFREVRDRQAQELVGKSPTEVIAYFSSARARLTTRSTERRAKRGGASR